MKGKQDELNHITQRVRHKKIEGHIKGMKTSGSRGIERHKYSVAGFLNLILLVVLNFLMKCWIVFDKLWYNQY